MIGWKLPPIDESQVALPSRPATSSLHSQSTRKSGTAASCSAKSMTDTVKLSRMLNRQTFLSIKYDGAVSSTGHFAQDLPSSYSRSLRQSRSSWKEPTSFPKVMRQDGTSFAGKRPPPDHPVISNSPDIPSPHVPGQSTWNPSHGISFKPSKTLSAPIVSPVMQELSSATNKDNLLEEDSIVYEEDDRPVLKTIVSGGKPSSLNLDDLEDEDCYESLTYHIPEAKMLEAQQAPEGSPLSYWSYEKYESSDSKVVFMHYCKTKEASERVAQLFIGKPVIGCDIEWKSNAKNSDGIKHNVSLIQIACEDRIGLFHIALHTGERAEDLLAPSLRQILESPEVLKCGVAIRGDFTRMRNNLGVEPVSLFELSHLHRLVEYGIKNRNLVNKRLVGLAEQAKLHLGLPLKKGDERMSDWSQALNLNQCKYAADDAYASYRIFEALKEKWYTLDPRPPFPAWAELELPIQLAPLPANDSASVTSESEVGSSVGGSGSDARIESLDAGVQNIALGECDEDYASDDSFGPNLFDGMSSQEIVRLEDTSISKRVATEQLQNFPALASELDFEQFKDMSPGRLGLQPRLRAISGRQQFPPRPKSNTSSSGIDSEQDLDTDEDLNEQRTDLQAVSSADRSLLSEATRWAAKTCEMRESVKLSHARAYYLWEHKQMKISDIAALLRDRPLKTATVAAYIAECIQTGNMPVTDLHRVREISKQIPRQARARYWRLYKMVERA